MMQLSRRAAAAGAAVALLVCAAAPLAAQANLSGQGLGYSPGQLSSRAEGTAGAIAEIDPLTPINPAAIGLIGTRMLYFQIEPEYRTVTTAGTSEHTTVNRYPNVFAAIPVGPSWVVSLGASTLLDRSSSTQFTAVEPVTGTDSEAITTKYGITGAMDDIRLAAAWTPTDWLRFGVGAHAITGHNLVTLGESFADSTQFSAFTEQRVLSFSGGAASAGLEITTKYVQGGLSGRKGGSMHLTAEDTVLGRATVPTHFGGDLAFVGIPNSAIAIRTAHDSWSSVNGLGSASLHAVDTWDTSVGADIAGPRIGDRIIFLRGGFRARTLPFQADAHTVSERSVSGGLGTTFANGHMLGDLAIIHANRSVADISASEQAWTISIGLTVRP